MSFWALTDVRVSSQQLSMPVASQSLVNDGEHVEGIRVLRVIKSIQNEKLNTSRYVEATNGKTGS
jgi:hypothetical protein